MTTPIQADRHDGLADSNTKHLPPPRRSTALIVVIVVISVIATIVAAIIALAIFGALLLVNTGKNVSQSPDEQIRTVVQRLGDEWNNSNFSYHPELECRARASYDQDHLGEYRNQRAQSGTVTSSVTNVHVTGDNATAVVTTAFSKGDRPDAYTARFVKEDGSWKFCTY
jgi:hypothetical protein